MGMALITIAGCGKSPSRQTAAKMKAKDAKEGARTPLPVSVAGTDWHIPWRVPDPKNPNGPTVPVFIADARQGTIENEDNETTVLLKEVQARLYRDGVHTANIVAPQMTANESERVVVGSGGCTITSLTDPPDTIIKADTITWDTHTSKIVAEGEPTITSRLKNGTPVTNAGAQRIIVDTSLKGKIDFEYGSSQSQ